MRTEAQILLAFMREANNRDVWIQDEVINILYSILSITKQEGAEIGELLKGDILEKTAMQPNFELVKGILAEFKFL